MSLLGQDNPSDQCIVGDVPEIWDGTYLLKYLWLGFAQRVICIGDESNHDGPYNGIEMGC